MEGKGVLFKRFADIDVFDLEIDADDPEDVIRIVKSLEPTFGGINLEDIKAPECFEIERRLKAEMSIPVFHDDQHGTAIISGAALLNAVELAGKELGEVRIVFSGAGAAAFGCLWLYQELGVAGKRRPLRLDRGHLPRPDRAHGPDEGGVRGRYPTPAPWPTRSTGPTSSSGSRSAASSPATCSPAWPSTRSSSPWPTPTRRSATRRPRPLGRT
jgi:malate dehydrogenase (oxaloacetate-decarboxylating)(NADP+)